jgi:uncharacterized membrane protein YkvI
MKEKIKVWQLATIFIGSIVGAGLSSGRELNQFFSVYGIKSVIGLSICILIYIGMSKIIIDLTMEYKVKSYNELIDLVCPKSIALFTNSILTLFLFSSTTIIFSGSSALRAQYFGVPRWIGFSGMLLCSLLFLFRNSKGLFEVNGFIVPLLLVVMSTIFFSYVKVHPEVFNIHYLQSLPAKKNHYLGSSVIYAGFNILSIIGVIVPLVSEMKQPKIIYKGICLGSILLTIMSSYIVILMLIHPTYPRLFEIPILAVAASIGKGLQVALLMIIWLEMFSSQVSNIFSLSTFLESRFKLPYRKGVVGTICIAAPFSFIPFSKLVEVLYPLYGVLSFFFITCCVWFYLKPKN